MLIPTSEEGKFVAGARDVLCILHDVRNHRYHAAFFEEAPLPGPNEKPVVRLRSKMHHTQGSDTLEGAREHLFELAVKIKVLPKNIWAEPKEWNGEIGITWLLPVEEMRDAV